MFVFCLFVLASLFYIFFLFFFFKNIVSLWPRCTLLCLPVYCSAKFSLVLSHCLSSQVPKVPWHVLGRSKRQTMTCYNWANGNKNQKQKGALGFLSNSVYLGSNWWLLSSDCSFFSDLSLSFSHSMSLSSQPFFLLLVFAIFSIPIIFLFCASCRMTE